MKKEQAALKELFGEVFRLKWKEEELPQYEDLLEKFTFHMLDTSEEVCELAEQLKANESLAPADFAKRLHRFFLHAVPHLVAAGQIYDYVPRLFNEQDGVHTLPSDEDDNR